MGRSRRQWLKLPPGMFNLKPQISAKCTLGSSFVEKTFLWEKKKNLQVLPSFMGRYEVCLSLRRVLGPRVHVAGLQGASAGSAQGVGAVHPPHPTICPPIC